MFTYIIQLAMQTQTQSQASMNMDGIFAIMNDYCSIHSHTNSNLSAGQLLNANILWVCTVHDVDLIIATDYTIHIQIRDHNEVLMHLKRISKPDIIIVVDWFHMLQTQIKLVFSEAHYLYCNQSV